MRLWSHQPLIASLGTWLLLVSASHGTKPLVRDMCQVTLEPLSKTAVGAPFEVRITVNAMRSWPCNSVIMDVVEEARSAKCVGRSSWTFQMDSARPFVTTTSVELRPNDTSYVVFRVLCPEANSKGQRYGEGHRLYFVTTEADVRITDRCPWDEPKPWPDWRDQPRGGFPVPGEFPLDDSLWGILKVDPVTLPKTAGPVDLRLHFSPARHPCDSVIFDVKTEGGLEYLGDTVWVVKLKAGVPIDTAISVIVPEKARTAIYVGLKCGGAYYRVERRLFTINDTLEYYAVHPWRAQDYPPLVVPQKVLTGMEKLRDMEKTPLAGSSAQFVEVDGVVYLRREGEYKFRVSPTVTDMDAYSKQVQDSMNAIPLTSEYDVKFIICDSIQMDIVKSEVTDLVPGGKIDSCEIFASRVAKKVLMGLAEKGIKFQFDVLNPVTPGSSSRMKKPESLFDRPDSTRLAPFQMSMAPSVILNENFEGSWPNQWDCYDQAVDQGGLDYWGRSTIMYHAGLKSLWCSGVGDMIDGSHYDVGQSSFLETAVDVHEYGNLTLVFWLWYDIFQFGFDNFAYYYSTDDSNWIPIESLKGTGLGWQYKTVNVANSPERIYLRFVFQSGTLPAANRGVYIDDIVVTGTSKCDLAPYTPAGWSGPVVLNSRPGVFQSGLLYQGEPIYLHAALVNWGPGTAEAHVENLHQIDGVSVNGWNVPELPSGYYFQQTNIPNSNFADAGWHQITYTADLAGAIPEVNESNNTWSEWFEWRPPEITIWGYL